MPVSFGNYSGIYGDESNNWSLCTKDKNGKYYKDIKHISRVGKKLTKMNNQYGTDIKATLIFEKLNNTKLSDTELNNTKLNNAPYYDFNKNGKIDKSELEKAFFDVSGKNVSEKLKRSKRTHKKANDLIDSKYGVILAGHKKPVRGNAVGETPTVTIQDKPTESPKTEVKELPKEDKNEIVKTENEPKKEIENKDVTITKPDEKVIVKTEDKTKKEITEAPKTEVKELPKENKNEIVKTEDETKKEITESPKTEVKELSKEKLVKTEDELKKEITESPKTDVKELSKENKNEIVKTEDEPEKEITESPKTEIKELPKEDKEEIAKTEDKPKEEVKTDISAKETDDKNEKKDKSGKFLKTLGKIGKDIGIGVACIGVPFYLGGKAIVNLFKNHKDKYKYKENQPKFQYEPQRRYNMIAVGPAWFDKEFKKDKKNILKKKFFRAKKN